MSSATVWIHRLHSRSWDQISVKAEADEREESHWTLSPAAHDLLDAAINRSFEEVVTESQIKEIIHFWV